MVFWLEAPDGEVHVMSLEEHKSLIKAGCEYAAGRVPVMAGVGCSTAKETIELAQLCCRMSAPEWGLALPPYYHKTSGSGIREFFKEVAAKSNVGSSFTIIREQPAYVFRLK